MAVSVLEAVSATGHLASHFLARVTAREPWNPKLEKSNLSKRFNLICPVQSPPKKHSPSLLTQITGLFRPVSPHTEGRIMIVTNAGWDAVDAAASGA
jgi:hypothetical protein